MFQTCLYYMICNIHPSQQVRSLGAYFDAQCSMDFHVGHTCKIANFHLRQLGRIRRFLTDDVAKTFAHAFITSRLDYANSLLTGISAKNLSWLQRVLNTTARILLRRKRDDPSEPLLRHLHWLPVKFRIHFKVLLLAYKSLEGKAPIYLQSLLVKTQATRQLRSASRDLLQVPKCTTSVGETAFSRIAPSLWNTLPQVIKNCNCLKGFKSQLKTHLFEADFSQHVLSI